MPCVRMNKVGTTDRCKANAHVLMPCARMNKASDHGVDKITKIP